MKPRRWRTAGRGAAARATTQIAALNHLGLKRIGQLYERNRKELQARFGASFLLRLDQALGWIEEKLMPRLPLAERFAEHRFAEPIGLIDDVLMCDARSRGAAEPPARAAKGSAAQAFHLFLYRVDHKVITLVGQCGARDARCRTISRGCSPIGPSGWAANTMPASAST